MLETSENELAIDFDVVAPSLPGYGWSRGTNRQGFGPVEMAVVLRNLMVRLGYDRFIIQGGDWGSIIGSHIATLFPQNVIGYHSNMCIMDSPLTTMKSVVSGVVAAYYSPSLFIDEENADYIFPRLEKLSGMLLETGYMHIQATKPDTIGKCNK